jgi:hypothetical protein
MLKDGEKLKESDPLVEDVDLAAHSRGEVAAGS